MPLIDDIGTAITATNLKTLGESVSFYTSQAMGDSVAHQRRVNAITEAALGEIINNMIHVDISEAVATKQETTGNAVAEQMASLGSIVAALQQLVKTAQTTPPETGKV